MAVNKAVITQLQSASIAPGVRVVVSYFDGDTFDNNHAEFVDITGITTIQGLYNAATTAVTDYATLQGWTLSTVLWSVISPDEIAALIAAALPGAKSFASPTLTLNATRRASTTRDAQVSVSVEQATTLNLSGGQSCTATLKYADDSGLTTNVVEIGRSVNGNTGTLSLGLNITQTNTATISGMVPANKYYSIVTTGTGTQTFRSAQEVLL